MGIARVKALTFNHEHQRVSITDPAPRADPIRRPRMRSDEEVASLLRAAGALNVGGQWGVFGGQAKHKPAGGPPRRKCDACFIYAQFDGTQRRDRPVPLADRLRTAPGEWYCNKELRALL